MCFLDEGSKMNRGWEACRQVMLGGLFENRRCLPFGRVDGRREPDCRGLACQTKKCGLAPASKWELSRAFQLGDDVIRSVFWSKALAAVVWRTGDWRGDRWVAGRSVGLLK